MAKQISQAQWDKFKSIINDFHEDANQDEILWYRYIEKISRHGEDKANGSLAPAIPLKCLMNYNYIKNWPSTKFTETGELDNQSTLVVFNVSYLKKLGYTNEHNKLVYKQDKDIFIHRGDIYLPTGDTFISQAKDEPLLFSIILKRIQNIPYKLP